MLDYRQCPRDGHVFPVQCWHANTKPSDTTFGHGLFMLILCLSRSLSRTFKLRHTISLIEFYVNRCILPQTSIYKQGKVSVCKLDWFISTPLAFAEFPQRVRKEKQKWKAKEQKEYKCLHEDREKHVHFKRTERVQTLGNTFFAFLRH